MKQIYDFAYSEQGYNHIKANKVCQDASAHYADDNIAIIAVADGHGSDNYPRTDRGSKFVVNAAINAIKEFAEIVKNDEIDITVSSHTYMEQLAKNILAHWYDAVENDFAMNPFSTEEMENVADKYKQRYMSGNRIEKAYGTTLIAVCVTEQCWFGIQIGDGKCVSISFEGIIEEPIPWDEDCQMNITTSICDSDAINEFRYCVHKEKPAAILIGTDGIDDSYTGQEELYSLYRSILTIFAEHGVEVGNEEVKNFLPSITKRGSGDDVSIAGLISLSLSNEFLNVLKAQSEYTLAKSVQEELERKVLLASEQLEYVNAALEKAKFNYDQSMQKKQEAELAIVNVRASYAEAVERYQAAEIELKTAIKKHEEAELSKQNENIGLLDTVYEEEEYSTSNNESDSQDFAKELTEEVQEKSILEDDIQVAIDEIVE